MSARSTSPVLPPTSSRQRSMEQGASTSEPVTSQRPSLTPRPTPSRETSSCAPPPARASTSSRTSRSGATRSAAWWRSSCERRLDGAHQRAQVPARPAPGREMTGRPKRLQFEWNLLVLVTAGLVLFGLVMVYSATSGSAALGNANPLGFVGRQVIYAVIGVALLVVVSRLPLERVRGPAPSLVVTALVLCVGVLMVGERINGARRWIDIGPVVFQPSELAKLAVLVWTAAYLSRHQPPRTLQELARPLGL